MTLHHSKHHQTYVNNLNAALASQANAISSGNLVEQIHLRSAINFNGGGHVNHTLFWKNLTPASSTTAAPTSGSAPKLLHALSARWGSLEKFKSSFELTLLGIQGSGWGWLVQDEASGVLEVVITKDQEVVPKGKKPLFGVDMWEHAYYLQYLNNKKGYVEGIWNIINWVEIEKRLSTDSAAVFGKLHNLNASL